MVGRLDAAAAKSLAAATGRLAPGSKALEYRHVRTGLEDVDPGFAGRQDGHRPMHRVIAALSLGGEVG